MTVMNMTDKETMNKIEEEESVCQHFDLLTLFPSHSYLNDNFLLFFFTNDTVDYLKCR